MVFHFIVSPLFLWRSPSLLFGGGEIIIIMIIIIIIIEIMIVLLIITRRWLPIPLPLFWGTGRRGNNNDELIFHVVTIWGGNHTGGSQLFLHGWGGGEIHHCYLEGVKR